MHSTHSFIVISLSISTSNVNDNVKHTAIVTSTAIRVNLCAVRIFAPCSALFFSISVFTPICADFTSRSQTAVIVLLPLSLTLSFYCVFSSLSCSPYYSIAPLWQMNGTRRRRRRRQVEFSCLLGFFEKDTTGHFLAYACAYCAS